MTEQKLGSLPFYVFQEKILIAIDHRWMEFFPPESTFDVFIDKDGRYTLRGPVVQTPQLVSTISQEDTR